MDFSGPIFRFVVPYLLCALAGGFFGFIMGLIF